MVYTSTGIIFELLLDVWPPTIPQYYTLEWKLWTISYEIFPSPCLASISYIFECKLKVISFEVLLDVWPPSTLFLNEYSWPLVTRNFLIFHLSPPYIWMQTLDHKVWITSRSCTSINTIIKWMNWRKIILCNTTRNLPSLYHINLSSSPRS